MWNLCWFFSSGKKNMLVNLSEDFMRSCQPWSLKDIGLSSMGSVGSLKLALTCMGKCIWELPSYFRKVKSTLGATGVASAMARDCSWSGILFYQEKNVVVWRWAGMVLLSFTPLKCFLDWIMRHKIYLQTVALSVSLCKRLVTWLSLLQRFLTTLH